MGYCLHPFAIDLDRLTRVVGCRDASLFAALFERFGHRFAPIDELAADHVEGERGITVRTALTHLVMGEPYREEFGFVCGYALELLCEHFGEQLPNGQWSAMRSDWFTQVDAALVAAGLGGLSVTGLAFRGPPVVLPDIPDFPAVGYLTRAEVVDNLTAFAEGRVAGVGDPELRAAVAQVQGWLQTCARNGRGLVTFYD